MKISEIAGEIEKIAPLKLAQDWDNVGLLVGSGDKNVKNILITIDITADVVAEAKRLKADMILSYHPVIWDGLKQVRSDGAGAVVYELVRAGICVYSIHTAYDAVAGGVNDALADMVGIVNPEPIGDFVSTPGPEQYKLVTFVPANDANKVAEAIYAAGAGRIGNYSHCGFQTEGVGTFLPLEGARPAIGRKGKLEKVDEIKLEAVVPGERIAAVVSAMRQAHPYETPAFDVFRHYNVESRFGLGRMGALARGEALSAIIQRIKKVTGAKAVGIVGPQKRTVRTAAVCAGSCGKIINLVIAEKCDLYLTGELKHHHALAAKEAGITCLCLSHTVSERFALKNLANKLKKRLKNVTIRLSKKDTDPFEWKNI
jgi:dinuclear metal center YbgI/SA1388 family protein